MNPRKTSSKKQASSLRQQTLAVRGAVDTTSFGEQSEPIFINSSFRFASAEQAQARFAGEEEGNVYSRFSNPTVSLFEKRLALLEGAQAGLATASGMAAIFACIVGLCQAGSKVVASRQLFGATLTLLDKVVRKFGVEVVMVGSADPQDWAAAADGKADLFFVETPSNPQLEMFDIEALAQVAHDAGALLVVDNCVCTPFLQRPLELGADLVMHSATKYIDGQGRALGGALCGPQEMLDELIRPYLRCGGPSLSPFNAWVLTKGLETLDLRMREVSRVAATMADHLSDAAGITSVNYPYHPSHPNYKLALKQQRAGSGLVSFELEGGRAAAYRFLNALELFSLTANFGDTKSTATHPATTTHAKLEEDERQQINITQGLVRLSLGLEDYSDLLEDVERGLAAANGS